MKIKGKLYIISTIVILNMMSCKTPIHISSDYASANFQTECMRVELDGSQTLRAFGKGKNKKEAIEQAKKNAVRDVIFKGINAGSSECNKRPLVNEVNAIEKHSYYFNLFFKDKGEYASYVKLDEKKTSRIKSKSSSQENWGVVVTVDREGLKSKLINDKIIKQ